MGEGGGTKRHRPNTTGEGLAPHNKRGKDRYSSSLEFRGARGQYKRKGIPGREPHFFEGQANSFGTLNHTLQGKEIGGGLNGGNKGATTNLNEIGNRPSFLYVEALPCLGG